MEVQLTDGQKAFVRQAIENGRYRSEEDALHEALSLWEGRERRRRDRDLRLNLRSFPVGEYVIIYRIDGEDALILHAMRGSRDIEGLLND